MNSKKKKQTVLFYHHYNINYKIFELRNSVHNKI